MTFDNNWSSFKSLLASSTSPQKLSVFFDSPSVAIHLVPISAPAPYTNILSQFLNVADLKIEEKTISLVKTSSKVVEEVVYTMVHDREIAWLLPNIKPTNRRLVVPLVFIASLNDKGLFSNINVYWDQASLLKQIGVLPTSLYCKANASEAILPVLGVRIADGLIEDNITHQDSTENKHMTELTGSYKKKQMRPVSGIIPQAEETNMSSTPVRQPSAISILPVKDEPIARDTARAVKTTGILPFKEETSEANKEPTPVKKTAVSSLFSEEPEVAAIRPSTKVHQPSGGYAHNIFSDEPVPLKTSIPIDPRRFRSQINLFDDSPIEAHRPSRRDPNRTLLTELPVDVSETPRTAKKVWSGKATESHFNIAAAAEDENTPVEFHSAKKSFGNTNASHFVFSDAPTPNDEPLAKTFNHRNPNTESESDTYVRPSSRVLRPPGGGSSILIG